MQKVILFLTMLLVLSPCQANSINVKRNVIAHKGGMRMPSATQVAADYEDRVVTVGISRYTGNVQVYVYDANGIVVGYTVSSISGSGTVTLDTSHLPQGDYTLCIVLDNATYSGEISM